MRWVAPDHQVRVRYKKAGGREVDGVGQEGRNPWGVGVDEIIALQVAVILSLLVRGSERVSSAIGEGVELHVASADIAQGDVRPSQEEKVGPPRVVPDYDWGE